MVIDLRELKRKGLHSCEFNFKKAVPSEAITLPNAYISADAEIVGELTVSDEKVYVSGCVKFLIDGECSRCLKPTKQFINLEFDETFEPKAVCDVENYPYERLCIDLNEMFNDIVLTGMPLSIYCKEDCKGLCPICGADLNVKPCECSK